MNVSRRNEEVRLVDDVRLSRLLTLVDAVNATAVERMHVTFASKP